MRHFDTCVLKVGSITIICYLGYIYKLHNIISVEDCLKDRNVFLTYLLQEICNQNTG